MQKIQHFNISFRRNQPKITWPDIMDELDKIAFVIVFCMTVTKVSALLAFGFAVRTELALNMKNQEY